MAGSLRLVTNVAASADLASGIEVLSKSSSPISSTRESSAVLTLTVIIMYIKLKELPINHTVARNTIAFLLERATWNLVLCLAPCQVSPHVLMFTHVISCEIH